MKGRLASFKDPSRHKSNEKREKVVKMEEAGAEPEVACEKNKNIKGSPIFWGKSLGRPNKTFTPWTSKK